MSGNKKVTTNEDELKHHTDTTNDKRRQILKSSLAVPPVVMSVMGKPAFGALPQCGLSGQLSGNLSQPQEVCGGQGCTPGFHKTHDTHWHQDIQPDLYFNQVYGVDVFRDDVTLGNVIGLCGYELNNGKIPASYIKPGYPDASCYPQEACLKLVVMLGFHSVAALQNAALSSISYDLTVSEVLQRTANAYNSNNKATIEVQKDEFDFLNNQQECPLGGPGTNCKGKGKKGIRIDYTK